MLYLFTIPSIQRGIFFLGAANCGSIVKKTKLGQIGPNSQYRISPYLLCSFFCPQLFDLGLLDPFRLGLGEHGIELGGRVLRGGGGA
jgi:hypothetical protein